MSSSKVVGFSQVSLSKYSITKCSFTYINHHQNFSFRDSFINYITKNNSSPVLHQKLILCCKYFFHKNPVLLVHCLIYRKIENIWQICCCRNKKSSKNKNNNGKLCGTWKNVNISIIQYTLWATNCFYYINWFEDVTSLVIPKNIRLSVINFKTNNQTILLDQLLKIGSTVKICSLGNVKVKNNDQSDVSIPKIIENLPSLEEFDAYCKDSSHIMSTFVNELIETSKFQTLKKFHLDNVSENFDIEAFYIFLKKNKTMDIHLNFNHNVSENFSLRCKKVINKMLRSNESDFWPPFFYIPSTIQNELPRQTLLTKAHNKFAKKNFSCICVW